MIHLRFDDITPWSNHSHLEKILRCLSDHDVSATFGIVPDNQDCKLKVADFSLEIITELSRIHLTSPCIAMHGYQHLYVNSEPGLLGFPTKSEFANLPYAQQYEKVKNGLVCLEEWGITTDTFFAPSHSFCATTISVLQEHNFKYILDGWGAYPYQNSGITFLPQQMGTLKRFPFGVSSHCFHIDSWPEEKLQAFIDFAITNKKKILSLQAYKNVNEGKIRNYIPSLVHKIIRRYKNA